MRSYQRLTKWVKTDGAHLSGEFSGQFHRLRWMKKEDPILGTIYLWCGDGAPTERKTKTTTSPPHFEDVLALHPGPCHIFQGRSLSGEITLSV